jgi:hypothetical protein
LSNVSIQSQTIISHCLLLETPYRRFFVGADLIESSVLLVPSHGPRRIGKAVWVGAAVEAVVARLVDEAKTIGVAGTETMSVPVGVGDPEAVVDPEDSDEEDVGAVVEDVDVPVAEETAQEQADEMRDVDPEHMETKVGSPVVAVFTAVV